MMHLHCAQVPPPPQAEGRNRSASESVCSSLPPAGTVMVFSPLISICTAPELTSAERAARMMATSTSTMTVNMLTPYTIVISISVQSRLDIDAAEGHKTQ